MVMVSLPPSDSPGSAPSSVMGDDLRAQSSALDDPQEWAAFGVPVGAAAMPDALDPAAEPSDQTALLWQSNLVITGMYCATCALTIEEALRALPGVSRVEVGAASQRARIWWNPQQIKPSEWIAALEAIGYSAVPALDMHARADREKQSRRALWRWLVAGFCMMQVMMYAWPAYTAQQGDLSAEMEHLLRWASWVLSLPVLFFACGPFFSNAWRDVLRRRISMDLPVALGMVVTFLVSTAGTFDPSGLWGREVYFDSFTMFVFFLLTGRWLQNRLQDRTAGALESLLNRLPERVLRRNAEHQFEATAIRHVVVGDTLRVMPGEAFVADGVITQGDTQVDEALLTGESTPQRRSVGDSVVAGSYNVQACVQMEVACIGQQTRFAHIVALMESTVLQKPRLAQLADRIARPFLWLVLLAAGLAAWWWWDTSPAHAVMVAVAVLIVTCPCALSLATPVALLTAAGTLAKQGVMVRRMQALETLAQVDTLIFDKTGTLTRDGMAVQGVHVAPKVWSPYAQQSVAQPLPVSSADLSGGALALAGAIANHSMHPASRAIAQAAAHQTVGVTGMAAQVIDASRWHITGCEEIPGAGLLATVVIADGHQLTTATPASNQGALHRFRLGSAAFALPNHHAVQASLPQAQATIHQAKGGVVMSVETDAGNWLECARFDLTETLRPEASAVVRALLNMGIDVQLLSGDVPQSVARVAQQVGIEPDGAVASCTPEEKLARMQRLQAQGRCVAMVGDGLNDGPVLAGAHASFAFGKAVPLAQAQSDIVVLGDNLHHVVQTLSLARQSMRIIRQNLLWALAYNLLCIPLAVAGWMPAWLAGLGMAASALLVVLNAARLVNSKALGEGVGASHAQQTSQPTGATTAMPAPEPQGA